ncbi:MAG TPA: NADH-quinone oxidoreductase subunit A [Acidimicrobiales bacterium]|nr:NADH-quinone oxidoreductase subunit A [Acidimicrobiales bacterium]
MDQYLPIFTMLVLAILFSGLSFFASGLLAPKRGSTAKEAPYECGIVPTREPAERFPVRFYVVAMLFIIFDIEIIFLYPWAVSFGELGTYGLVAMIVFAAIVFISLLYEIAMGGLEWGATNRLVAPTDADGQVEVRTSTSTIRRVPKAEPAVAKTGAAA